MILQQPLWLLPALLLLIAYVVLKNTTTDAWQRVMPSGVYRYLSNSKTTNPQRQIAWLYSAIACVALSGPSIEAKNKEAFRHAQGWIVIADVSRSMTLNDVAPSRLAAMRDTAIELAKRAKANSTTLIVYAGDAFIITPPSFDNTNYNSSANLLSYGVVPVDGSNLTRALSLALSVTQGSDMVNARLFVLSDTGGFNTRSTAAIAHIADLGHRTDLILFGTESPDNAEQIDLEIASNMANSGNGIIVRSDAIGNVNFAKLDLDSAIIDRNLLSVSGLTTLVWSNQSHWLLLAGMPLMLVMFYREFRS